MRASPTAIGLLLLLLFASKSQGRSIGTVPRATTPPVGTGRHVPIVRTGEDDFSLWSRTRLALVVVELGSLEPPIEPARIDDVATAIVAQWAHESAKGRAEFNYNLGGWTARKGDDFHTANDNQTGAAFRWTAYPDLPTAVEDQVKRLILGFPSAWALLVADPSSPAWIDELARGNYFTANPADYARAWASLVDEIRRLPR